MNVWGRRGEWDQRRTVLRRGLAAQSADLAALQEVVKTDRYDQMSNLLGTDFYFAHQAAREPARPPDVEEGQGVSIASRWPILAVEELDLKITPRTQNFAATALIARIDAPEPIGQVLFVNYLPSWKPGQEYEREQQAVATLGAIQRHLAGRDAHVIVAGDLDAEPDNAGRANNHSARPAPVTSTHGLISSPAGRARRALVQRSLQTIRLSLVCVAQDESTTSSSAAKVMANRPSTLDGVIGSSISRSMESGAVTTSASSRTWNQRSMPGDRSVLTHPAEHHGP